MKAQDFLEWLHIIETMKCTFRHSKTSCDRDESVAEHSYRLVVMAYILKDKLPNIDMDKVLEMCIVHDFGEAITGDIPSFLKTEKDDKDEMQEVLNLISTLPQKRHTHIKELFLEMEQMESLEAKAFKALDKMEAVIQHNESNINSWLGIEYELQQTYGIKEASEFEYLKELREQVLLETKEKIEKNK